MSLYVQNSRLYDPETDKFLATWTSLDGLPRRHWPGGQTDSATSGRKPYCACGVTGTCHGPPGRACNCAGGNVDGSTDFGVLVDKLDLPVKLMTFGNVENVATAESNVVVGWLSCAPTQFGIAPSCQAYRDLGRLDNYAYLIDPDGPPSTTGNNNSGLSIIVLVTNGNILIPLAV